MDFLPEGRIYPTETNRSLISSQSGLEQAMNEDRILEAKACLCNGSHDLIVSLGSGTGIIPREVSGKEQYGISPLFRGSGIQSHLW